MLQDILPQALALLIQGGILQGLHDKPTNTSSQILGDPSQLSQPSLGDKGRPVLPVARPAGFLFSFCPQPGEQGKQLQLSDQKLTFYNKTDR